MRQLGVSRSSRLIGRNVENIHLQHFLESRDHSNAAPHISFSIPYDQVGTLHAVNFLNYVNSWSLFALHGSFGVFAFRSLLHAKLGGIVVESGAGWSTMEVVPWVVRSLVLSVPLSTPLMRRVDLSSPYVFASDWEGSLF